MTGSRVSPAKPSAVSTPAPVPFWLTRTGIAVAAVAVWLVIGFGLRMFGMANPREASVLGGMAAVVVVTALGLVNYLFRLKHEPDEAVRRARGRNLAIGIALFCLVAMFYAATMIRLGGNVFNRAI